MLAGSSVLRVLPGCSLVWARATGHGRPGPCQTLMVIGRIQFLSAVKITAAWVFRPAESC